MIDRRRHFSMRIAFYTEIPRMASDVQGRTMTEVYHPKSEALIDINELRLSQFVMKSEGKNEICSMSYPSFKISIKSSYLFIMI